MKHRARSCPRVPQSEYAVVQWQPKCIGNHHAGRMGSSVLGAGLSRGVHSSACVLERSAAPHTVYACGDLAPNPADRCDLGGGPEDMAALLEGESLFNDATSIVLFDIFLQVRQSPPWLRVLTL